ncbi:MAG: hypothetical protein F4X35_12930, partial [Alphaproteobacteria bacterium]|nr:hypothetical protein [Alphaproteobacteria bacterium]
MVPHGALCRGRGADAGVLYRCARLRGHGPGAAGAGRQGDRLPQPGPGGTPSGGLHKRQEGGRPLQQREPCGLPHRGPCGAARHGGGAGCRGCRLQSAQPWQHLVDLFRGPGAQRHRDFLRYALEGGPAAGGRLGPGAERRRPRPLDRRALPRPAGLRARRRLSGAPVTEITVAEAYLALLKARGVDVLFANPGTDFAPIVEAYARAGETGLDFPTPHTIVHETVAVGMADGYWQASGRMAAVMAHVNVGTANALMGLINARRDNVPIFMAAGRSPVTEKGRKGARDRGIHWGQDMYDQAGMLREAVKWDYELRLADQLEAVVERALAVAATPPKGPVYFTMPREIMAEPLPGFSLSPEPRQKPVSPGLPDPAAIAEGAAVLSAAARPLIVANRGAGWQVLADFAERFAMPVVEFWASRASLPGDHPMHGGFDPGPWLERADAVLVLDAMVPWMPAEQDIPAGCKVVQAGADPLFSDVPMRGFPADVAIAGDPAAVLEALAADMAPPPKGRGDEVARRCREGREARIAAAEAGNGTPMSPGWVARCLDRALPDDAMIFNELGAPLAALTVRDPLGYFGGS